ncbi:MAG TPA: diacylglycerol kinase family protein [Acidimicrobiales bacterium]|nr:diacylglycerol kinase family protein [Acidimicrobiales bacterium]
MTRNIHLVVNPTASSVTPRARVVISRAFASDANVEVHMTERRGHATELAGDALRAGADVVVVLGGDGTLNEVACALAGSRVRLGVLPGGSTNVFARSLGMSDDPVEATAQLIDSLGDMHANEDHMSLGTANGRHFVFHTGVGFDAAVVQEVEKRGHLKRWIAHPLFIWSAFRTWAGYDRRARFRVEFFGGSVQASPLTLVLNRDPYTYLGERPLRLAVGADFDTGFAVACFKSLGLVSTVAAAGRALMQPAGLTTGRAVRVERGVKQLAITADRPFHYQVDGDYIDQVRELRIAHMPASLWVLRPGHAPGEGS